MCEAAIWSVEPNVRSAVLGWIMREGPLLYDALLGQHMKLGHNLISRTGEAA